MDIPSAPCPLVDNTRSPVYHDREMKQVIGDITRGGRSLTVGHGKGGKKGKIL